MNRSAVAVACWLGLLLVSTLPVVAANEPPVLAAVYTGPTLAFATANLGPQVIEVTGIAPGPAGESGQGLTLLAYALEPGIVDVSRIVYVPGASTASIDIVLVGNSIPRPSSRILITLIDDGSPAGVTTVAVDIPLAVVNLLPYLPFLGTLDVPAFGSRPFSPAQFSPIDRENDPVITYTVMTLPARGVLEQYLPADGTVRVLAYADTFTQADIAARYVSYRNTDGATGTSDVFYFNISDQGQFLHVPVNYFGPISIGSGQAGPEVILPVPSPAWTEGDPPVVIAGAGRISHPSAGDLAGGQMRLSITDGARAGDHLELPDQGPGPDQVGLAGSDVQVGGVLIGTWSTGGDGSLTVAFTTPAATPAVAQVLVRAVRFRHAGDDPGTATRSVEVVVSDGRGGSSAPVYALVPVSPVDDPPVLLTQRLAMPLELAAVVHLQAADPDSPVLAWSLRSAPADLSVTALGGGAFLLAATASGSQVLRFRVDDGERSVEGDVEVVVSGPADARPQPAGDAPREAFASGLLVFDVPWEVSDLGGSAGLEFSASAEAPPGLLLERTGDHALRVSWQVPADEPLRTHRRFSIIAQDRDGLGAGRLPVSLWIRPPPQGGG